MLQYTNDVRAICMMSISLTGGIITYVIYFICEQLHAAAADAEDAVYFEVDWCELTPNKRKPLFLAMTRWNICLKAGGISPMTFESFMKHLKRIHSNCVVLQNLLNKY